MKEIDNHIETLIARKINGEITAKESQALTDWAATTPENARYLADVEKIYAYAGKESLPPINIDQEWQRFKNTVHPQTSPAPAANWLRRAASIVVIAVLGYFIWNNTVGTQTITITAQHSGQEIMLPDSSVVTLNKYAVLTYPRQFSGKSRTVQMAGEAFFAVTRNENKPFTVNVGLSTVEVLGTSFNINARQDNDRIAVVVTTGKVRFTSTTSKEAVILTKGEKGILMKSNNVLTKTANDDVNFMAWKTRKIIFDDVELDEVIQTLNKLYEAHVSFSTDVSKDCKVTVTFDNQSLDAILSVLEVTLDLEYRKSGDIIEVVKTGC